MKIGGHEFNLRELGGSLVVNMAAGFAAGLVIHLLFARKRGGSGTSAGGPDIADRNASKREGNP